MDKRRVGVKQYFWKVHDYITRTVHGGETYPPSAYDASVNGFNWVYENFPYPVKIDESVFTKVNLKDDSRLKFIVEHTNRLNIPNLGDWGMGIHDWCKKQCIEKPIDISICIVTFKERYNDIKRLIKQIRNDNQINGIDILLAVNGNNCEITDETYRKDMLKLCGETPQCFPIICPEYKSLSKLWNTLVIFSKTEYNFIICDDVEYQSPDIITNIKDYILKTQDGFFTINSGFSHFVITKKQLHKIKYFDERYIAHGEEDGDMVHRYIKMYNKYIPNITLNGIYNKALYSSEFNIKHADNHIHNKPKFNRMFNYVKYRDSLDGICGMNPTPLTVNEGMETVQQYPYEEFVENNKHNISKYVEVVI